MNRKQGLLVGILYIFMLIIWFLQLSGGTVGEKYTFKVEWIFLSLIAASVTTFIFVGLGLLISNLLRKLS